MRVLIIGGTGFIGSHVSGYLRDLGHSVVVLHRGKTKPDLPGVHHIFGSHDDLDDIVPGLTNPRLDAVVDMILLSEQAAMKAVLALASFTDRLVAISSMDVYSAYGRLLRLEPGQPEPGLLNEDSPLRTVLFPYRREAPNAAHVFYNYEKILVERVVMNHTTIVGTVLRLPAIYGPGDRQHRVREYLKSMDEGVDAIELSDAKAQWRWTRGYVENVAAAIAMVAVDERTRGRIYNVGEMEIDTEKEWVRDIGRAAGWPGRITTSPLSDDSLDFRHHLAFDASRIRKELQITDPVTREEGLRRTVDWERANPNF